MPPIDALPDAGRRVADAHNELKRVVIHHFDQRMWLIVDACCSVVATLMLRDSHNPVGLILVDHPSSGKTTALSMFYGLEWVYRSDSFTPSAFVSHASNVKKEKLREIDLLPRIQYKCLLVPELAPVFGQKPDDLLKSISILTRVFDGEGYCCDSGAHGSRGYTGDYYFSMLGATLPMPKAVWKTLGLFGSRLLFLTLNSRLSAEDRMAKSYLSVFDSGGSSYRNKVDACREAVNAFFTTLNDCYAKESFHRSVSWAPQNDSKEIKYQINILAEFTSRTRSKIAVWDSKGDNQRGKLDFSQPLIEGPERLASVLYSLACGHAIINGRTQLAPEDLPLVIEVALSSMPDDRRQAVHLLLQESDDLKEQDRGLVSSSDIERALTISRPTALNLITTLDKLGIGEQAKGDSKYPDTLKLKSCYNWLLSSEFEAHRQSHNLLR